jgi:type II secretory pathway pseudopilin PulG
MRTCESCRKVAPDEAAFCPGCGTQFPIVLARKGGMSGKTAAILVVAICIPLLIFCVGIISAITIPNLLDATARARQKRAAAELKSLATAIQSYETDFNHVPLPDGGGEGEWREVEASQLSDLLVPAYTKAIPSKDPWGAPYFYGFQSDGEVFYLLCTGSDRTRQIEEFPEETRRTHCYESDLFWVGSRFEQWPEGRQRKCGGDVAAAETQTTR